MTERSQFRLDLIIVLPNHKNLPSPSPTRLHQLDYSPELLLLLSVYSPFSDRVVVVVVVDLPLLRVAVEGSDNPVSLEKPCQASLPPNQQGRHSLRRQPEVQYVA